MDTLDSPVVASVSAEAKQLDRPIVVVSAFADNVFDDANDAGNPQLVAEYVADIMRHLRTVERRYQPSASYMTQQRDINPKMREVLIDWIVDVHLRFRMQEETLFLAINYIDRFLEVRPVHRSKLQLVGCTALLLAAKYEEIFAPDIRDLVFVSDKACTSKEILHLEGVMLTSLKFNLTVATTLRFLERYTRISGGSEEFVFLVKYLCELALQHYGMLRFLPSQIASAAVLLARRLQSEPEVWTQLLQQHTEYSEADLASCVREIFQILVNPNPRLSAVRRKFASAKYLNVARYPLSELTL
jgi:cyclin B